TLFTFSFSLLTNAQQLPLYSSYVYNPFLLSPSNAGNMEYADQSARLMLGHRYQYAGFEGAPSTSVLTLDAPIARNMGLGGTLYTDKMGLIRQTGLEIGYGYHISFENGIKWHLGASLNAGQQSLDFENALAEDVNENIINLISANKIYVNGSFGTHVNIKELTLGLTIQQLTQNQMVYKNYTSNTEFEYNMAPTFLTYASYSFRTSNSKFGIKPILVTRYISGLPMQFDALIKADVKEKFFLTTGYRGGYALSFGAGARLNDNLILSYTYDHMVNDAGPFTGGGNEFTLGYNFFKGKKAPVFDEVPVSSSEGTGLTQDQVDQIFEDKLKAMREKMDAMLRANENQRNEISRLNDKIDSLNLSKAQVDNKNDKSVVIKDGFVANNLQFNTGSAWLTLESQKELERIAIYLLNHPEIGLDISGHTDNTGNSEVNLILSKNRAERVYDYLVERGIDKNRMTHNGYGDTKPVASNSAEEGRTKNRRVELKIK
ncbi:MAG: PorP/SprF family type IX secretion system membrane protein, partial [Bacteroidetes bacterium]|nr:PorP/SprF family type IX secretion system membrane protein [Bacteroidota bacterium]